MRKEMRKESLASRRKFCDETLALVAEKSWDAARPLLKKKFGDSLAFFPFLVETISMECESLSAKESGEKGSLQDYLFEKLMARFDALQKNRASIIAILTVCRSNGSCFLALEKALYSSFEALFLSHDTQNRTKNLKIKILGLLLAYHTALYAWREDFSNDMAATMAQLNDALSIFILLIKNDFLSPPKN